MAGTFVDAMAQPQLRLIGSTASTVSLFTTADSLPQATKGRDSGMNWDVISQASTYSSFEDLKTLRLVNKQWSNSPSFLSRLFRTALVNLGAERIEESQNLWKKFMEASHRISPYIREISIIGRKGVTLKHNNLCCDPYAWNHEPDNSLPVIPFSDIRALSWSMRQAQTLQFMYIELATGGPTFCLMPYWPSVTALAVQCCA